MLAKAFQIKDEQRTVGEGEEESQGKLNAPQCRIVAQACSWEEAWHCASTSA